MKTKIILHGYLKELYPAPIEVEADTIAEAIRSLENIPELWKEDGSPHLVQVDGVNSDIALYAAVSVEEIHIRPRLGGAGGRGGLMQILIGVALIAVAFIFPAGIALGSLTISTSGFLLTGAMMALGGIVQLLTPVPEKEGEGNSSKYLGASGNTVAVGTRVPLVYGTRKKGGHYLSFDVDAVSISGRALSGENLSISDTANYFVMDKTATLSPSAPVNPVYASSVPGPPVSSWGVV